MKLFCFPYAGGSASVYHKWKRLINQNIEIIPIEFNGRGKKISLTHCESFEDLVRESFNEVKSHLSDGEKYALFGHSMGGILVYELANKIFNSDLHNPSKIFISGANPPILKRKTKISHLDDDTFLQKVIEIGGTPEEIASNLELREIFLPILKADFSLMENYQPKRYKHIGKAVVVLYGLYDQITTGETIEYWGEMFDHPIKIYGLNGGHFFIKEDELEVIGIIEANLI
ncbi:hypothetical protein A6P54_02675 [Bacillus sp. MKU004]|nr:hypothetical protein A6P54_02675 [Bacillus sp. MKU004]